MLMKKFMQKVPRFVFLFLCMLIITSCRILSDDDEPTVEVDPTPQTTPFFISNTPTNGTLTRALDGMIMISIPAGEFTMGAEGEKIEQQHMVYLNTYWIDQTEVTNGMYAKCVADSVCQEPSQSDSINRESYYGNSAYAEYPVIYVNWDQAQAYCNWVGTRLPTEAEWEKAARGTDGRLYPWGNGAPTDTLLNYDDNVGDTMPVGSYPAGASPYGALDLSGNVWEWTADWFDGEYYAKSPYENPQGPSTGTLRVTRGGSWSQPGKYGLNTATWRAMALPEYTDNDLGFRCAFSEQ
jgi:formylglycine-generating enzyme required for sulfatase activity